MFFNHNEIKKRKNVVSEDEIPKEARSPLITENQNQTVNINYTKQFIGITKGYDKFLLKYLIYF